MENGNPQRGLIRVQSKSSVGYLYLLMHLPLPDHGKEAAILGRAQKAAGEIGLGRQRGGALGHGPQRPVAGADHGPQHREDVPAGIESTRNLAIGGGRTLCHQGGVEMPDLFEDGG